MPLVKEIKNGLTYCLQTLPRGQASFKNSERPQDFQLLNRYSPTQDLIAQALLNPAVLFAVNFLSCKLFFSVLYFILELY